MIQGLGGFGGVAEYGITVRWNKNFLKVIRLLLERRREFSMFGGVRFGGTLTIDSSFEMGFDHIAIAHPYIGHEIHIAALLHHDSLFGLARRASCAYSSRFNDI